MTRGSRRGCIALKKAILGIDDEEESTFTIHVDGRTFHFQGDYIHTHTYTHTHTHTRSCSPVMLLTAQNAEERERWIQALDSTIRRILQPVKVMSCNVNCCLYCCVSRLHTH